MLRPVLILDDAGLARVTPQQCEFGAFVHVDDVATATVLALRADVGTHARMTLCGPGEFNSNLARTALGWQPRHDWPGRDPAAQSPD